MEKNDVCERYYNETLPYVYSDVRPEHQPLFTALTAIFYLYGLVTFILFVWTKNWVVYSKQKSITTAIIYALGMQLATTAGFLREAVGRKNFPCQLLGSAHHIPVICLISQPVGLMYFYIYKLRMERMKTSAIKKMFNEDVEQRSNGSSIEPMATGMLQKRKGKDQSKGLMFYIIDFLYVLKHSKNGIIVFQDADDNSSDANNHSIHQRSSAVDMVSHSSQFNQISPTSESESVFGESSKQDNWKQMMIEQVGIPIMMMVTFGLPYLLAIVLRIQLDPVFAAGCRGCSSSYVDEFMKLFGGGLFIPLAFQGLYAMRNEPDPLRVTTELKYAMIWGFLALSTWIPNIVYSLQGVGDRVDLVLVQIFAVAIAYYELAISGVAIAIIERRRAKRSKVLSKTNTIFSTSSALKKETVYSVKNLPPPSALDLDLILFEPKARSALLEHTINEISSENLVFVFKLRAWKSIWDKEKPEKLSKMAEGLFKEYISKECNAPINIPHTVFSNVERAFNTFLEAKAKDATIKPNKNIYDSCEFECLKMLEYDALPRFCRSDLFKKEIIEAGILDKILNKQSS